MHAHFDCFSGISGDMALGAFVDLGVPVSWLAEQVGGLDIGEVEIVAREIKASGLGAKKIEIADKNQPHSRTYKDVVALIQKATFSEAVEKRALDIFERIARAEAHVHRSPVESVHFHEVGAVDSIVDIVGTALCLDYLKIESVSCSPLPLGFGFVDCDHGRLPVPAPATLEIVKRLPVRGGGEGEMVTPTGAAIIASIASSFGPMPAMEIDRIGYGAGSRKWSDRPNLLRVLLGKQIDTMEPVGQDEVCVLETNIDDMNPEITGYLMERLLAAGALDVCLLPAFMKKNRPGTKIEVISSPEHLDGIAHCLLTESSTIGVRYQSVRRKRLQRSITTVPTQFGDIESKCIHLPGGQKRYTPEYESCRQAAMDHNVPLRSVYDEVAAVVANDNAESKS